MNSLNGSEEKITSQNFDFLKKVSRLKGIYLRAFQKSMIAEMDKDLPVHFKDDKEMFKDIKQIVIKHLSSYMDEKFCAIINAPDMQEKLLQYYELDSKYHNKSSKFAILSAKEETNLKSGAIELLKAKKESMQDLINQTNQLKDDKYTQLEQVFNHLATSICTYNSIGGQEFDKNDLF